MLAHIITINDIESEVSFPTVAIADEIAALQKPSTASSGHCAMLLQPEMTQVALDPFYRHILE